MSRGLGESTTVSYEWAVKVDCLMHGVPGPHILSTRADEGLGRTRYAWWKECRPEASPVLLCRQVVTTRGAWQEIAA